MKKLFLALFLTVFGFSAFAEELRSMKNPCLFSQMSLFMTTLNYGQPFEYTNAKESVITEICPVNKEVCKVVLNGKFVEYLELGSIIEDHRYSNHEYYKVVGFGYNIVHLKKTEEP